MNLESTRNEGIGVVDTVATVAICRVRDIPQSLHEEKSREHHESTLHEDKLEYTSKRHEQLLPNIIIDNVRTGKSTPRQTGGELFKTSTANAQVSAESIGHKVTT